MENKDLLSDNGRIELKKDIEELHSMSEENSASYKSHYLKALAEIDRLRAEVIELRKIIERYKGEINLIQDPD